MSTTVVIFSGEYDISCQAQLQQDFSSLNVASRLVLDLGRVSYVDSTFMSELMTLHNRRERNGFRTEIIVTQGPVSRLFDILSLQNAFRIVPTLREALKGTEEPTSVIRVFEGCQNSDRSLPPNPRPI